MSDMGVRGPDEGQGWVNLAANAPGIGLSHEAARRRHIDGLGADRSWRVGADGEVAVAAVLAELTEVNWWARLRGREPGWRVLHSVPLGDGQGRARGDVDHLMVGPPGVVTINSKHHRGGRLALHGEQLVLNGHPTAYVPKARQEAERVRRLLAAALAVYDRELLDQITVRSMIAIVGGRLLVTAWAPGVSVVKTSQLIHALTSLPARLESDEVDRLYELARRSTTWNPPAEPITDR